MINKQFLMRFRSILIELLNALDDELIRQGAIACRTIPSKSARRKARGNLGSYRVDVSKAK